MKLTINGEEKSLGGDSLTINDLLNSLELSRDHIAVELNLDIVPSTDFSDTSLKEGDSLEIVQFVGGG